MSGRRVTGLAGLRGDLVAFGERIVVERFLSSAIDRHESQSDVSCLRRANRSRIRFTRRNQAPRDSPWPKAVSSISPARQVVHASPALRKVFAGRSVGSKPTRRCWRCSGVELRVGQHPALLVLAPMLANPMVLERVRREVGGEAAAHAGRHVALAQGAAGHQREVAAGAGRAAIGRQVAAARFLDHREAACDRQRLAAEISGHAIGRRPVRMDHDALDEGAQVREIGGRREGRREPARLGSAPWVR
jgi:hypothetical protein